MADGSLDTTPSRRVVAVAMKCVRRIEVDSITGRASADDRFAGPSAADEAALELALRRAEQIGASVLVVCVGDRAADTMLRNALACGADRVVRIDPGLAGEQASSFEVARAVAATCSGAAMVFCGDWSLDRGSGSVPALIAYFMGIDQALGVVNIRNGRGQVPDAFDVERRLDGGRREVLTVSGPSVISVEGAAANLRRADIGGVLSATSAPVEVLSQPMESAQQGITVERVVAHRAAAGPLVDVNATSAMSAQARLAHALGIGSERTPPLRLVLEPSEAAETILDRLQAWGIVRPR